MSELTLYHVHDPMCSWCWAYSPVLKNLLTALNEPHFDRVGIKHVVGGLAPDSDQAMPDELAQHLQGIWKRIQGVVPGTQFNFDFWTANTPRRSTWPSCRAVLAAQAIAGRGEKMTQAIQRAYYLEARNPSDTEVLVSIADEIGIDSEAFAVALASEDIESSLQQDFQTARRIGAQGFPSLFMEGPELPPTRVTLDYAGSAATLGEIGHYCR